MSSIASMRHRLESRTEFFPDLVIRPQIFRGRWLQVFASKLLALRLAERYDIPSVSPRLGEAEYHASLTVAP
jgi:hypothetical protein